MHSEREALLNQKVDKAQPTWPEVQQCWQSRLDVIETRQLRLSMKHLTNHLTHLRTAAADPAAEVAARTAKAIYLKVSQLYHKAD